MRNEQGSDSFGLTMHRRGIGTILKRVGFISICCDFIFVVFCCLYFPLDIPVVLNFGSNLALIFMDRCNLTKMTCNSSILNFFLDCHSGI